MASSIQAACSGMPCSRFTDVYPELWDRLEAFEKEQIAKAGGLPPQKVGPRKAQIQAFIHELRVDIKDMIAFGYSFVEIAVRMNEKIAKFETSQQEFETHNAEYQRDAQKVRQENASLSDDLRKMQPDVAPYKCKSCLDAPKVATHPKAVHSNLMQAYDQINKIAQEWHQKTEHLPEDTQVLYREQVNKYVGDLNSLVSKYDDPRLSEQIIRHNARVWDEALERHFKHNTYAEWFTPLADDLF